MKLLLSLLVVANLLAFASLQGWLAPLAGDGRDPGRADQQVNAGELRVVPASRPATAPGAAASSPGTAAPSTGAAPEQSPSPGTASAVAPAVAPAPGPATAVPATPAPTPVPAPTPAATPPPAPAAAPPAAAAASGPAPAPAAPESPAASLRGASCVEIGPLPEGDALRVQAMVDAAMPGLLMDVRRLEEVTSYWVYLPPSPTMADAQRRVAELKQLGISEYYLMPDGPFRGAISLGLFRQDDLAFALQRSLAERGVRGARVAPRGPGTSKMTLRVRPVTSELPAELARIRAAYPEAVARPCPN